MKPIPLCDPVVLNMPARECGEGMVQLKGLHPKVLLDDSAANEQCVGYKLDFSARASVAEKLHRAAEALPCHIAILVKETLRPLSRQEFSFSRRVMRLSQENPDLTHGEVVEMTSKFVAPPHVAGHPTGGAVDLTLCSADGTELDMGCAYDQDEIASNGACFSFFAGLSEAAGRNREILFDVLSRQGFVNYPFEWWHWSYGDKYWAAISKAPEAIYLPVAA